MQRYFYTLIIAVSWCVHYCDDAADDNNIIEGKGNLREKVRWNSVLPLQDKSSGITNPLHNYLLLHFHFEWDCSLQMYALTNKNENYFPPIDNLYTMRSCEYVL